MTAAHAITKILAVTSPDTLREPVESNQPLLERAVSIARASGASIELFHACTDPIPEVPFLADDEDCRSSQQELARKSANRLAELAQNVDGQGVDIDVSARWGRSRVNTIIEHARSCGADLVLKESMEHKFLLGIFDNPDWELIRHSPANVWFMKPGNKEISRLVTAVGSGTASDEVISPRDYEVFRLAQDVAELFAASNTAVHCYELPANLLPFAASYEPMIMASATDVLTPAAGSDPKAAEKIAVEHGAQVRSFASYFGLDPKLVQLRQGHPSKVLPEVASANDASLIVMGARDLSGFQRATQSVSAEPVLSESRCDVLYVRDQDQPIAGTAVEHSAHVAEPQFNAEEAAVDPAAVFDHPARIVDAPGYSYGFRKQLLRTWQEDVEARLRLGEEGGPAASDRAAEKLRLIQAERERLAAQMSEPPAARPLPSTAAAWY